MPVPDYKLEEYNARLKNIGQLAKAIKNNDVSLLSKIKKWAERVGLEFEFVLYKVKTDPVFAMQFAKDPQKQSLHQSICAKYIESLRLVECFEELPPNRKGALYVQDGCVVSYKDKKESNNSKSIDFKWQYTLGPHIFEVYAMHKHTNEEGGAQDNQFADLKLFLNEAKKAVDENILFLTIADGDYYLKKSGSLDSRLQELAAKFSGKRSIVCTINDIHSTYGKALQAWMYKKINNIPDDIEDLINLLISGEG